MIKCFIVWKTCLTLVSSLTFKLLIFSIWRKILVSRAKNFIYSKIQTKNVKYNDKEIYLIKSMRYENLTPYFFLYSNLMLRNIYSRLKYIENSKKYY